MAERAREDALATLRRGTAFLSGGTAASWLGEPWPAGPAGVARSRLLSNWLRELDCFLHAVLDAAHPGDPGNDDAMADWSAVHRLGRMYVDGEAMRGRQRRLLALQRSRYTFWHFGGVVRRADAPGRRRLTAGWPVAGSAGLRTFALGERLAFDGAALADICGFYERLGTGISTSRYRIASSRAIKPAATRAFPRPAPHMSSIVATSIVGGSD